MPASTMAWAVPGVLGAAGLFGQSSANSTAERLAHEAQQTQSQLIARQVAWYDTLMGKAKGAEAAGQFDPGRRLQTLSSLSGYNDKILSGNAAGAAKTLGYKPGDSTPLDTINQIHQGTRLAFQQQANDIIDQSFFNKMQAYSMANPGALNTGVAATGDQQRTQYGRMVDPSGLIGSIAQMMQKPGGGTSAQNAPMTNSFAATPNLGNPLFQQATGFGDLNSYNSASFAQAYGMPSNQRQGFSYLKPFKAGI